MKRIETSFPFRDTERMNAADLEMEFTQAIPITKAMGLHIAELSALRAVVEMPFDTHVNHVSSAFGGSIYSAGALACYALFRALTESRGYHGRQLVIQEGRIEYKKPVLGIIRATASAPDRLALEGFFSALERRGKGRLRLTATIGEGSVDALFIGDYVYSK